MKNIDYPPKNALIQIMKLEKNTLRTELVNPEIVVENKGLIRFELKREYCKWIHGDDLVIVISNNHYVKALIKYKKQNIWMNRHCTIKELLCTLPHKNFIRLNKFYLLNINHFSHINEIEKIIYFNDGFSMPLPHRISRFILDAIKNNDT